ncbi:MAG TPA: amidohydrolase family protein [Rhizomicrobium sp.]|jgi:L-fuconolactonase|nr:amidohydrolase family protein [Rhizomicrobium sp.]
MRIDAHHHLWRPSRGDYGWLTPELALLYRDFEPDELRPLIQAAGIEKTILVQAAPTEAETDYLLAIADRTDWIAGVVGWTDLAAPDAPKKVAHLAKQPGLVGLRPMLQDLADPDWILKPDTSAGLSAMVKHGLVFDALIREAQLPTIVELARRLPMLSIVLDHAGKPVMNGAPRQNWHDAVKALADCPNVTIKLSGLLTEAEPGAEAVALAPYFDALLEAFSADRILWGSDWPVLTMAASYPAWVAITEKLVAGLDAGARAAIWGGTAAKIYNISL